MGKVWKNYPNLKKERNKRRLTQTEIAKDLGIQYNQYSRYEKGINEFPIHYLVEICKLFEISSDDLLEIYYGNKKKDSVI